MPLYRTTQCGDSRQNTFIDLPNRQWHGTLLLDKSSQIPVANEGLEKMYLGGDTSYKEGKLDPSLVGLLTEDDIDSHNDNKFHRLYNSFNHGFGLGRYSYLASNHPALNQEPSIYVNIEDQEKPYIIDFNALNMSYFVHHSSNYMSDVTLVKYNTETNEIVWQRKYTDMVLCFRGLHIMEDNCRLNLGIIHLRYLTQSDNSLWFIATLKTTPYYHKSFQYRDFGKAIIGISKDTGNISVGPEVITLRSEGHELYTSKEYSDPTAKFTYYNTDTFGTGGSLVPCGITRNKIVLFSIVYDSEADYDSFTLRASNSWNYDSKFKASFCTYDINTLEYSVDNMLFEESVAALRNTYNNEYDYFSGQYNNYPTDDMSMNINEFPKASYVDKDYENDYVVYACIGRVHFYRIMSFVPEEQNTYRQVYRFKYNKDTGIPSAEALTMLNVDGNAMTFDDWEPNNLSYKMYTQPFIARSENKKYLVVYLNICTPIAQNNMAYNTGDAHQLSNKVYLLEFINENTLQLRQILTRKCTNIFWENEHTFVLARDDKITYCDITDEGIIIKKNIFPKNKKDKFVFCCYDDGNHLWYYEAVANEDNPNIYNSLELSYLDRNVLERIEVKPEYPDIIYIGEDVLTNIKVAAKNVFDEYLIKTLKISISGNAVFRTNNDTNLTIKTLDNDMLNIPVLIQGTGDISYNVELC